jgi:hypothetical protein
MDEDESQLGLEAMMDRGPAWLDGYLRQYEEGRPIPQNRMMGIVSAASSMAFREESLDWAGIALRAADLMASERQENREPAFLKAMRLRAWFIVRMGSRPDHPVLDKEIILRWVIEGLTLSIEEARDRSVRVWDQLSAYRNTPTPEKKKLLLDDMRALRAIKSRLYVLHSLADVGELPSNSSLRNWLEIRGQLP